MYIHFSESRYGSYGGGLEEPFRYLGRIMWDKFQSENINFWFEELEIQLTYFSPKVKKEEYIEWYNKLPIYYRGKRMVRVILPVEEGKKTLDGIFQLIYLAFDILASKKKKTDVFDTEKSKAALIQLEEEMRTTDLWELNNKYKALLRQETIERRYQERMVREQEDKDKKRLIYDLRFYYRFENIGNLYFSPYDNRFADRVLNKLRERKFRLPDYSHLYIMVSDTFANALYHAVRAENWFVYGIAVMENYADYPTMKEVDKKRVVFDLIKQGLNDIATIDKLDMVTLNEVLNEVEQDIFKKYKYLDKES